MPPVESMRMATFLLRNAPDAVALISPTPGPKGWTSGGVSLSSPM